MTTDNCAIKVIWCITFCSSAYIQLQGVGYYIDFKAGGIKIQYNSDQLT